MEHTSQCVAGVQAATPINSAGSSTELDQFGSEISSRIMSSSSGGGEASRAAGGQVIVVHDAMEFSLASRSTEPTHIVLADHISFMVEFSDVPANAQAAIDVAVTEYIQSIRGNCTTPPSLNALGASDSVDLIPGQCMVVVGSLANYKFSGDLWIDGIYFKQTHQNQPRPLGGGMYIPKNAWITSCTLDWSSQGDDGCPDCPEWLDGGIFVDGGLYVKDSILANFKGVDLIETNREAFTTIEDSRVIRSTISEAVLTGVHGINGKGSTVYIERCSFEETSGPSLISTRWWQRGHDPVFFCDTELPMYNYDREKRAVSETFSRSLSELPDERQSAVLISEDPTFLSMKQNLPKIDRRTGVFQNGTPATTVLQGDSLIINGAGAPVPQSTSVGAIMGFIAAGIAFLILLSAIILVIMRGRARRKQSVNAQEKVTDAGESERSHEVQSRGPGGISSGPQTQTNSRKPSLDVFDLVAASRTNSTTDFQIRAKPYSSTHPSTVQASGLMAVCGCFTQRSTTQEMSADGSERKPWGSSSPLQVSSSQERSSLSCNGSNRHLFRSSLRAKLGQGTDTTSSTVGTSSSQRVSDGAAYSRCATWAPEDVQVTRMPTGGCQMTCQTSCLTTMGPTNTLTKQLCTSSSPGTKLQLQLEWINANRGGHLFDFLKLIPHLGKKTGGQGVVLFAEHSNSPLRQYAIKFFLSNGSFDIERGAVCNPALRVAMPPVSKIESDPDALLRPVEGLPEPLNQWPLPPMIVTEKGESLDSFAARSAPDFFTSLQVMMHIARKLEGLHEAGWVHRDLKPGNAIWLPSSNSWTLIDFGSAARIGEKADMAFTVKYAAPETIQGFRNGEESCTADPAVDVWAFGMICFELLTYQKFYGVGTTADEVMCWLTSGELLPSEKELDPHILGCLGTEAFRVSILGMLSRDPASRPTVSQLINTWNQIFPQPAQQPSSGASAPAFHADAHSQREQTSEISQG